MKIARRLHLHGEEQTDVATSLHLLASMQVAAGDYDCAGSAQERLAMRRAVWGRRRTSPSR